MKKYLFLFILIATCFFKNIELKAQEVKGVEMTYQYVGSGIEPNTNVFRLTLSVYKNCSVSHSGTLNSMRILHGEVYSWIGTSNTELDSIVEILNPEFPCHLLNDSVCIHKGIYNIDVELPISDTSYFITYQGCCRVDSINNILDGLFPWGVGNHIEITPSAQQTGNSSPVFTGFPSAILCKDELSETVITAEDLDGDQLIFEFFNAYDWMIIWDTVNVIQQWNPFAVPPYNFIPFNFPQYHYTYPFGLTAYHDFNPATGDLEVIPNQVGNYTIGFQVSEFRNGQLLSTVYRDFLVKVVDCEPQVIAHLAADTIDAAGNYVFNLCNENTLEIDNQSTYLEYIQDHFWTFDLGSTTLIDTTWQPTLTFSDAGTFTGQLVLNPDEMCSDTANIIFQVTTELQPDFVVDYDTCVGGAVNFYNTSATNGGAIQQYDWVLGDGASSALVNPIHAYATPGEYAVQLHIENEQGCRDSLTRVFLWQPAPPVILIAPSEQDGCSPLAVHFENLSTPVDSTYQVIWEMGDGGSVEGVSPDYSYVDTGVYSIYVAITSPIGGFIDTVFSDLITVVPPPQADFSWTPEVVSNLQNEVFFENESIGNLQNFWLINEDMPLFGESPSFSFDEIGTYDIQLLIKNEYGCMDSLTQQLNISEDYTYYLPNAFTPNEDGRNEVFKGKGIFTGITNFEMSIWNRYGERVFFTKNIQEGWNGRHGNTGKLLTQGVYICQIKFDNQHGEEVQLQEKVTLIR